ncbi:MAG: family 16 glycosylhydrolase [Anaerolineae bacterium]
MAITQRNQTSTSLVPPAEGLKLVFADEFDQHELDSSKWADCYWWDVEGCTNKGNSELEWYLPENVKVGRGSLILEARKEMVTNPNRELFPYSSGMVTTGRNVSDTDIPANFSFQFGYVEVKAKFPAGKGLWPAIWLLPITHESRPEIDILEILGDEMNAARMHIHYIDSDQQRQSVGHTQFVPNLGEGWQTIGLDWQPDRVTWFLNGDLIWEVTDPEVIPQESLYLIINLAVGGDYPGSPNSTTVFPSQVEVDYVRIWQ